VIALRWIAQIAPKALISLHFIDVQHICKRYQSIAVICVETRYYHHDGGQNRPAKIRVLALSRAAGKRSAHQKEEMGFLFSAREPLPLRHGSNAAVAIAANSPV
jgi:hypothetical protein